ncbi:hypothetical protein MRX96_021305 [Rhipicephalus microplus]
MPRSSRAAKTFAQARAWPASLTAALRALCHLERLHRAPDAGPCSRGYVQCRITVLFNTWTSTTALWLTILHAFRAGHPITRERAFDIMPRIYLYSRHNTFE